MRERKTHGRTAAFAWRSSWRRRNVHRRTVPSRCSLGPRAAAVQGAGPSKSRWADPRAPPLGPRAAAVQGAGPSKSRWADPRAPPLGPRAAAVKGAGPSKSNQPRSVPSAVASLLLSDRFVRCSCVYDVCVSVGWLRQVAGAVGGAGVPVRRKRGVGANRSAARLHYCRCAPP